jgi:hypothetical protein
MAEVRLRLAHAAIWIARLLLPRHYSLIVRRSTPLPPEVLYILHGADSAETSKGVLRRIANALGRVLTTAAVLGITFGAIQWFLQTPDRVEAERATLWAGVRASLLFPSQAPTVGWRRRSPRSPSKARGRLSLGFVASLRVEQSI